MRYHLRQADKEIRDEKELLEIIKSAKHMTIAMCTGNEPYLSTVNFGYDHSKRCFYFHCSPKGRKANCLRANPAVWGQMLVEDQQIDVPDRYRVAGECQRSAVGRKSCEEVAHVGQHAWRREPALFAALHRDKEQCRGLSRGIRIGNRQPPAIRRP